MFPIKAKSRQEDRRLPLDGNPSCDLIAASLHIRFFPQCSEKNNVPLSDKYSTPLLPVSPTDQLKTPQLNLTERSKVTFPIPMNNCSNIFLMPFGWEHKTKWRLLVCLILVLHPYVSATIKPRIWLKTPTKLFLSPRLVRRDGSFYWEPDVPAANRKLLIVRLK